MKRKGIRVAISKYVKLIFKLEKSIQWANQISSGYQETVIMTNVQLNFPHTRSLNAIIVAIKIIKQVAYL